MKKIILGVAVLAAFSLASCKKANRVCECTSSGTTTDITLEDKTTKKNALFYCQSQGQGINAVVTNSDGSTTTVSKGGTVSCKLK